MQILISISRYSFRLTKGFKVKGIKLYRPSALHFVSFVSWGGAKPFGTSATIRPIVPVPGWQMGMKHLVE
jgi:hypothetical protein